MDTLILDHVQALEKGINSKILVSCLLAIESNNTVKLHYTHSNWIS